MMHGQKNIKSKRLFNGLTMIVKMNDCNLEGVRVGRLRCDGSHHRDTESCK